MFSQKGNFFMDIIDPSGKQTMQVSTEWLGRKLTLEVNRVGFRTTSSVLATYGDTVILASVVVGQKPVMQDFFPLSIDYEEKFYAAGKSAVANLSNAKANQPTKLFWLAT